MTITDLHGNQIQAPATLANGLRLIRAIRPNPSMPNGRLVLQTRANQTLFADNPPALGLTLNV